MGVADADFPPRIHLYDFFTNFLDQFYAQQFSIEGGQVCYCMFALLREGEDDGVVIIEICLEEFHARRPLDNSYRRIFCRRHRIRPLL